MYISPRGRASLATIALGALIVISAIWIISTFQEVVLLRDIADGAYANVSDAEFYALADANDSRQALVGLLALAIFLVAIVTFLMWQYRVRKNADYIGTTGLRFSPGWVIGWWFIPIMGLFRPYQVMKEMWQSNYHNVYEYNESRNLEVSGLLGWWWGLLIVSGFISSVSLRIYIRSDDINTLIIGDWLDIGSSVIWIVSAVLAIVLIREISDFQESKHRMHRQSERPPMRALDWE